MNWHRIFGLVLIDFFTNSPFEVELEKDLSIKRQLLDAAVLRKLPGEFSGPLPDGLESLKDHNLITYKSHQEALDDWTIKELTGHYVNYRKQVSPSMNDLLPEATFGLYAVCARFPQGLASHVHLDEVQSGVYNYRRGTDEIRIIVTRQLPETEHNAVLHLFSAAPDRVRFGVEHYQRRTAEMSGVVNQLFEAYQLEGLPMPYTMEDFRREFLRDHLGDLTPEERLKGLPPEERLKGLPPEERLKGLTIEEIEEYLRHIKGHDDTAERPE
jgi:hypothetical protein